MTDEIVLCKNCKNWFGKPKHKDEYGYCKLARREEGMYKAPGGFMTKPDFGCILWEESI